MSWTRVKIRHRACEITRLTTLLLIFMRAVTYFVTSRSLYCTVLCEEGKGEINKGGHIDASGVFVTTATVFLSDFGHVHSAFTTQ